MSEPAWWQRGAIYQIYPRSFADSNGDGVGDLAGHHAHARPPRRRCRSRRSGCRPIFTSPMADFGYDVADYCDIDPVFGTLARPRRAGRGVPRARHQAVLDWVPNHSSDQHPWFLESALQPREPQARLVRLARRAQRLGVGLQGLRRRRGPSTRPREQYYLHSFMPEQPDLNWDNPEVERGDARRAALLDGPRRRRPAAGRDRQDRQGPAAARPRRTPRAATTRTGSRSTSACAASAGSIDEYDDRMIVGEVALQDLHRVVAYLEYGDQLHLAHNFVFIDQDWDAETYATSIADFETLAEDHAWPAWFLANHDNPRPRQPLRPRRPRRAARPRDPGDALRAARHAVHLPGRGARACPDADDPARPRRRRRRPRPRARADPVDARRARPRLHDRRTPWLPFVDEARRRSTPRPRPTDPRSTLNLTRALATLRADTPGCDRRRRSRRRRPGHRSPGPRGDDLLRRGQLHRPGAPAAADGELVLSSDPDRTAGERLARTRARRSSCDYAS